MVRTDGETVLGADDKAAVAAAAPACFATSRSEPPAADVEFVFTAGEEIGLQGAKALDPSTCAAAAVFVFDSEGAPGTVICARRPSRPSRPRSAASPRTPASSRSTGAARSSRGRARWPPCTSAASTTRPRPTSASSRAAAPSTSSPSAAWCTPRRAAATSARLAAQVAGMVEAFTVAAAETGRRRRDRRPGALPRLPLGRGSLPLRIADAALAEAGLEARHVGGGGGSDANVFNAEGPAGPHARRRVRARALAARVHPPRAARAAVRLGPRHRARGRAHARVGGPWPPAPPGGARPEPGASRAASRRRRPGVPRLRALRARHERQYGGGLRPRPAQLRGLSGRARGRCRRPRTARRRAGLLRRRAAATARPAPWRAARRACAPSTRTSRARACAPTTPRARCARPSCRSSSLACCRSRRSRPLLAAVVPAGPLGQRDLAAARAALRLRPAGQRAPGAARGRRGPRGRPRALRRQGRQGARGAHGRSGGGGARTLPARRPPRAAARAPPGGALPERARRSAHAPGPRLPAAQDPGARRHARAGQRAHPAALVRHAPAGRRRRPAQRAGDARARQRGDHAALHSRHRGAPARGLSGDTPAGAAARAAADGGPAPADRDRSRTAKTRRDAHDARVRLRARRRAAPASFPTRPPTATSAPTRCGTCSSAATSSCPNLAGLGLGEVAGPAAGSAVARGDLRPPRGARRRQGHHHRPLGDDGRRARAPVPDVPSGLSRRGHRAVRARPSAAARSATCRPRAPASSTSSATSTWPAAGPSCTPRPTRSSRSPVTRTWCRCRQLYGWCEIARGILQGPHAVGRVIARPFDGASGAYARTPRRRDFSLAPPGPTYLDLLHERGVPVVGVGKIGEIFVQRGVDVDDHTTDNTAGIAACTRHLAEMEEGLLFANLVDFDQVWGHRNDVAGFAEGLAGRGPAVGAWLTLLRPGDVDDPLRRPRGRPDHGEHRPLAGVLAAPGRWACVRGATTAPRRTWAPRPSRVLTGEAPPLPGRSIALMAAARDGARPRVAALRGRARGRRLRLRARRPCPPGPCSRTSSATRSSAGRARPCPAMPTSCGS